MKLRTYAGTVASWVSRNGLRLRHIAKKSAGRKSRVASPVIAQYRTGFFIRAPSDYPGPETPDAAIYLPSTGPSRRGITAPSTPGLLT